MRPPNRNPILYREWCIATRPAKFFGILLVVLALTGLTFLYTYLRLRQLEFDNTYTVDWPAVFESFSITLLTAQFFICFFFCLGQAMNAISAEKARGSHEFLVTLPISATDKTIGLAFGPSLLVLFVALILAPIGIAAWVAAGLNTRSLLGLYAILIAGLLAVSFTGVIAGNSFGRGRLGWVIVMVWLFGSMGMTGVSHEADELLIRVTPFSALAPFNLVAIAAEHASWQADQFSGRGMHQHHFYGWTVPWQVGPVVMYLFFAALSFVAAAWKLNRPQSRPLRRWATLLAFAIFHILFVGFMTDLLIEDAVDLHRGVPGSAIVYLLGFFLLIFFWSTFSTANYGRLMEWVEQRGHWTKRLVSQSFGDLRTPPLVAIACIWIVTVCAAVLVDWLYWNNVMQLRLILAGGVLLLFMLAYYVLFLTGLMMVRRNGAFVGMLFVLAAFAIPGMFATIEGLRPVLTLTPIGLFNDQNVLNTSWDPRTPGSIAEIRGSLIAGAGLLLLFGVLCAGRFQSLLRKTPQGRKTAPSPA